MFENDQVSISMDHVTWVERKRDGAVTVHFPGADTILMNKSYGPAFMDAYYRYHHWRSSQPANASANPGSRPPATPQQVPPPPASPQAPPPS